MDFDARGGTRERGREHADGRVRMPFGKHKGIPLEEIPDDYLLWVLDNVPLDNRPSLCEAIRHRLGLPRAGPDANLEGILKTWYRSLSLDFHPDRGGSTPAMAAINEAHDRLRKMLGL
jgi:hypothetical protein